MLLFGLIHLSYFFRSRLVSPSLIIITQLLARGRRLMVQMTGDADVIILIMIGTVSLNE
jgi:hypothetical protein